MGDGWSSCDGFLGCSCAICMVDSGPWSRAAGRLPRCCWLRLAGGLLSVLASMLEYMWNMIVFKPARPSRTP